MDTVKRLYVCHEHCSVGHFNHFIHWYIYAQIKAYVRSDIPHPTFTFSRESCSSFLLCSHDNMEYNEITCFYPDFHSFLQNINTFTGMSINVNTFSAFKYEQMFGRLLTYSSNEILLILLVMFQ